MCDCERSFIKQAYKLRIWRTHKSDPCCRARGSSSSQSKKAESSEHDEGYRCRSEAFVVKVSWRVTGVSPNWEAEQGGVDVCRRWNSSRCTSLSQTELLLQPDFPLLPLSTPARPLTHWVMPSPTVRAEIPLSVWQLCANHLDMLRPCRSDKHCHSSPNPVLFKILNLEIKS